MDPARRQMFLEIYPVLNLNPPDSEFVQQLLQIILSLIRPPPDPSMDLRRRIRGDAIEEWSGNDVFTQFSEHRYSFYLATGETPETMLDVLQLVKDSFTQYTGRPHKLSQKNRVMLYIMWLRSYQTYHVLALIFNVSVATVQAEINGCMPIFQRALESFVQWPALDEWRGKRGIWSKLPAAVGAIDGTSVEIYRPQIEPQELYYSGHRNYHAIHTQVIVDNEGSICYVESGFLGHQSDAQQYRMMRQIVANAPLNFPEECVLLGDKIYPNRHPVITPFTRQQITRKPDHQKRKSRKFNRVIAEYRILVEHAMGDLKNYKVMGTLWRHPRQKLRLIVETCAGFVNRRQTLFD